jgi:hypothetical protein
MGMYSEPKAPAAPDYGAANREAIETEIELLPERLAAEADARLKYDPLFQEMEIDLMRQASPELAQIALDVQERFGSQFVESSRKQLEQSDPEGFKLRQELGQKLLEDLKAGRGLTDREQESTLNSIRGAQVARGNFLGDASAFQEMQAVDDAGFRKEQQRYGNAGAFLGNPLNAQFSSLSGAQQGSAQQVNSGAPFQYMGNNTGAQGAQFASNIYGTQSQNYANAPGNPWMAGLGMLGGAVGTAAAGPVGGAIGSGLTGLFKK